MSQPLYITSRTDWTPELLESVYREIETIAHEELELKGLLYPNQIEVISSEQMLDAYASIGMPVNYNHWSFGKEFLKNEKAYQSGRMGLAYEIVINSDPCISYLMEENSMLMQTMVIAHAAVGHNAVFRNNETFKQWTNAGSIIDYMIFARDYIRQCEQRYGVEEVENVLDAAHALAPHGVDKFKRRHRPKLSDEARLKLMMEREERKQRELDIIMKRTSFRDPEMDSEDVEHMEEEENLLYFIMKRSPSLEQWKREILRIVYKVNQYFYPQGQCVTGDNLVSTGKGLLRLDELITAEGYVPVEGIKLLTQGDRFTEVSHTYRKKAKVLRVRTQTGRVYVGTPEHPLMALQGIEHGVQKLGDLRLGDHLVLNTDYTQVFAAEEVKLKPLELTAEVSCNLCGFTTSYLPTHIKQTHGLDLQDYDGELSSMQHRSNKSVNFPARTPETLSPAVGELIAYLQSMTISDTNVFSATRPVHFDQLVSDLFGLDVEGAFSSWGLRTFISQFELKGVPRCIRTSPAPVVAAYLRGRFDAQAVVRTNISTFKFNTYDQEEAAHLQVLLGALGIISTVKEKHWTTFSGLGELLGIEATGRPEATIFCLEIDASHKHRFEEVIGTRLDLPAFNGNPRVASRNLIPGGKALLDAIWQHVRAERSAFTEQTAHLTHAQKVRSATRLKDQQHLTLGRLPVVRAEELSFADVAADPDAFRHATSIECPAAQHLKRLLDVSAGCFYDRVVSIEELEEEREVYDVTVPENHLFWMSGLISHNTKNLNEGYATFCHYYIMTRLEEKGILSPDAFMAFLDHHSGVIFQPTYDKRYYSGINPYALGFAILMDVKRICEGGKWEETSKGREWVPITDEDREWFPHLIGRRWQEAVKEAVFEHRDDSFVQQYLSPKVMRDFKMFSVSVKHDDEATAAVVSEIHDDIGYRTMRVNLARSMERINYVPQIKVVGADLEGDRTLRLAYEPYQGRTLDIADADVVTDYVDMLWGYPVELDIPDAS